ncbi:MAG: sulfatase [Gemmatimonadetes bacterium]|nr:sulfatase [Gemmatimonadota bacterium]
MPSTTDHRAEGQDTWAASHAFWWLLLAGSLAGALGEATLILGARIALHRYTLFNPQGIWMAPLANLLLLVVPLGLVALVARRWGARAAVVATAFAAVLAAAMEPLLVVRDRVHPLALLALALGVATQVARFARARPTLFARLARAATVGMLAISVASGIGFNAVRAWRERSALAALGAAPDGAPNVILLVLDTVRALSLSAYGYDRATSPFLAELAARGARFDRAISPAPWTLPSHATMFTGRYPHELSSGWSTPLDASQPTVAERLSQHGYATLGVAANLRYCSYEFGLSRGFARYRDYDISWSELLRTSKLTLAAVASYNAFGGREISPGRQSATRINERLLALIDARGQRPFFAFANYYDAHGPYNPPAPYDTLFLGRQPRTRDSGGEDFTAAEITDLQAAYDASIADLDRQLRDLFRELQARGLLDNTMVIVTSDHGEEFNEHGLMNHGSSLYFPSVHVPLIVVQPGAIPASTVVDAPVTLRDLASTMLHAARGPDAAQLPGTSLARWWQSPLPAPGDSASRLIAEVDYAKNLPKSFAISKGDMKSEVVDGFRYILRGDGHGELFDVRSDPWERHDLAGAPEQAARVAALRARVMTIPRRNAGTP